jgi:hypothetical protein
VDDPWARQPAGSIIDQEIPMIDLARLCGDTYRITRDEAADDRPQTRAERPWMLRIPCKYGHIYVHAKDALGASAAGRLITGKLAAIPGVRVHQRGDSEITVVFPPVVFPDVAALLQARKRRKVSKEQATIGARRLADYWRGAAHGHAVE